VGLKNLEGRERIGEKKRDGVVMQSGRTDASTTGPFESARKHFSVLSSLALDVKLSFEFILARNQKKNSSLT
jgi:hypothetical protein